MAKKKSSPTHRPAAAQAVKIDAVPETTETNGSEVDVYASSAPATRISLDFGIDNVAAVVTVYAENKLLPKLEQQVAEVKRLGNEVTQKTADIRALFDKEAIDPKFEKECKDLVAAAEKLGMRLSVELTKTGFNPDTLKYEVTARFLINVQPSRDYTLDSGPAEKLRDEVAGLRVRHAEWSEAAARTKYKLSPERLDRRTRAFIGENAMLQTESGTRTLEALFGRVDREVVDDEGDPGSTPARRQLSKS